MDNKPRQTLAMLLQATCGVKRHLAELLAPFEATPQQYSVLRILRECEAGGLPTLGIADRLMEQTPGITRLIDRLERKGWVLRQKAKGDRRQIHCSITPAGLELLAALDEPVAKMEISILAPLNRRELDQLASSLERMVANS